MYELGEGEEEQEEGYEDADGEEAQEEASGSGLQMALLGSFGTSGQCVFDIVCTTDDEILADESTEVHDLGPDLKSDCLSEKTHESSLDHDFGFSCHDVSSVCLGEATRGIGGASDVVFQNGSFGLVGSKRMFLKGMCRGSMGSFVCHCCHLWRLEGRTTGV